ncbi:uncharacterized protein LOC126572227 [Anopheles aquasalis]|nr:uncharacterized protein LOC126572227 [Anopheles aquasalis]
MAASHLIEKLKFGERYILADIVVVPLTVPQDAVSAGGLETAARNKYLTRDVWQSFVYTGLYDLFRRHLPEHGQDVNKDSPFQLNQEYRLHCKDRPYLQMKYNFRDKHFRNTLNGLFREKSSALHDSCVYVEISDQGQVLFNKIDDREKTVLRLVKEIEELKAARASFAETKSTERGIDAGSLEYEEYHPEPLSRNGVDKIGKEHASTIEYVPATINGQSIATKRTYKPSKIGSRTKTDADPEPDPYTPDTTDRKPSNVLYVPSSQSPKEPPAAHGTSVKRERNLFGSDDEEYDPAGGQGSGEELACKSGSDKDMFADDTSPPPEKRLKEGRTLKKRQGSSSHGGSSINKREVLHRNSKQITRNLAETVEEEKRRTKSSPNVHDPPSTSESSNCTNSLKLKNGVRKKKATRKLETGSLPSSGTSENGLAEKPIGQKQPPPTLEVLDCMSMSNEEIIGSFDCFEEELRDIFYRYKDLTERHWKTSSEVCYYTDLTHVVDEEQKLLMLDHLEDAFVLERDRGKYTEFFTSTLMIEWTLRLFMQRHHFRDRRAALDRIRQQETAYFASLANDPQAMRHK